MCGIIGYVGGRSAAPVLLESLQRLEYRGYDSAGIAVLDGAEGGHHTVVKSDRKVADLVARCEQDGVPTGHLGIGHTRWATHGRPTVVNAHPHQDCHGRIQLIHNGIIENHRELRAELVARGHLLRSETDTEVLAHLIEELYDGDLAAATRSALRRVEGAYALVVISADEPRTLVGARRNAPLVASVGEGEVFLSSDITALIPYARRVTLIGEDEVVTGTPEGLSVTDLAGAAVTPRTIEVDWDVEQAQKGGYPHFMLKEINEQPEAVENALRGRIDAGGEIHLDGFLDPEAIPALDDVRVIGMGSAWIAGLYTATAIRQLARLRCEVENASEFRYGDPLVDEHSLVIAISQSGETADTLAAVREARRRGARVVAVTNVVGSALSLEADAVLFMQSGPEICVLATKTLVAQMVCGLLIALALGAARGALPVERHRAVVAELREVPGRVRRCLELEPQLAEMAQRYAHVRNAIYIARGINVATAYEGALKLKEVSYIHAEGYAAGELKHGPIALLDAEVPVVAVATRAATLAKTLSSIAEVRSRDAPVIALVTEGDDDVDPDLARDLIRVPACTELISPLVNVVPLQLFAYHVAVERGCDVDQPRNLAKSVTVE
ncbi:MAG: glutamine--fructose-6-phosphate transaminase (isomerizing) [Candidatus Dormibacteria bacterium]|jgi:glucosamine--fructose-6-phosphate aminotransferase (isomerizing)|nr:glutamine--fructose-6-phosphate transaminase (isomerizing) [Chloroflexota bacterium]HBV93807.1 glutamine--fructose-6-phosphate transaminase (isomerizing) [Chloroflexota bacterium]